MTTTITVSACCADTKEVKVNSDTGNGPEEVVLQDGENATVYVHEPEHFVTVTEVDKVAQADGGPGCEKCDDD